MIWTPFGMVPIANRRSRPSKDSWDRSVRFLHQVIKDSGLPPGLYTKPDDVDYGKLAAVHIRLCDVLERDIREFDILDLCSRLYRLHDSFMVSTPIVTNERAIMVQAVRSLTELAIRSCGSSGVQIDEDHYDYILSLAYQAVAWDAIWDQLSSPVFPQIIQIEEDYSLNSIPNPRASKATEAYENYLFTRSRLNEIHRGHPSIVPVTDTGRESVARMLVYSDIAGINRCLAEQVDYSLADYITFVDYLTQISLENGYDVCGLDLDRFVMDCQEIRGIRISSSRSLIRDFALSVESIRQVSVTEMFSVGRRNRDSRFVRRPVSVFSHRGISVLIFGRA